MQNDGEKYIAYCGRGGTSPRHNVFGCTSVKRHGISDEGNGDSFVVENKWWWLHRVSKCCYSHGFRTGGKGVVRTFSVSLCLIPQVSFFFFFCWQG